MTAQFRYGGTVMWIHAAVTPMTFANDHGVSGCGGGFASRTLISLVRGGVRAPFDGGCGLRWRGAALEVGGAMSGMMPGDL